MEFYCYQYGKSRKVNHELELKVDLETELFNLNFQVMIKLSLCTFKVKAFWLSTPENQIIFYRDFLDDFP